MTHLRPVPEDARRSRWFPYLFFAFFGVVLAVNGTMLGIAIGSWNGLHTTNAYQRGLAYNRNIEAAASQAALGWQVAARYEAADDGQGRVLLDLADRYGYPIGDAVARARLVRPTHAGYDRSATLQPVRNGRYAAALSLPLAGQWDLRIDIEAGGRRYQHQQRLYVTP